MNETERTRQLNFSAQRSLVLPGHALGVNSDYST